AFLSSCLLSASPLHVVLSHAGTPDISIFFLFYLILLLFVLYRRTSNVWMFFGVFAFSGVAMADKFFLPALIPLVLLIGTSAPEVIVERSFGAGCLLVS